MLFKSASLSTGLFFFLLLVFLLRNGYLLIDEEFFIVVAFLSFLAFIYGQVANGLAEGLDTRIAFFYTGLTQARDSLLRIAAGLYGFYQGHGRLSPSQPTIRRLLLTRLVGLPVARMNDLDFFLAHHSAQTLRLTSAMNHFLARAISLATFYSMFVVVRDAALLNPFIRKSDFAAVEEDEFNPADLGIEEDEVEILDWLPCVLELGVELDA